MQNREMKDGRYGVDVAIPRKTKLSTMPDWPQREGRDRKNQGNPCDLSATEGSESEPSSEICRTDEMR